MHFCSTADIACTHCGTQSPLALDYIKVHTQFCCPHCGEQSEFDPGRHTHDILMYEMGRKLFSGFAGD